MDVRLTALQRLHLRLQGLDALRRPLEFREELLVLSLQPRLEPRHLLDLIGVLDALPLALRPGLEQLPLQPRISFVNFRELLLQGSEAQSLLPAKLSQHRRLALLATVINGRKGLQRVEAVDVTWPDIRKDKGLVTDNASR